MASISRPRFSLAGALSIAVIAVLAFMLGRNDVQGPFKYPANQSASQSVNPSNQVANSLAGIDSNRLLTHSVSGHLDQVNLILTQFANSAESSVNESGFATDMLVANRLYRQAASRQGNLQLAAFLAELEPLLIEMAYEAQSGSTATRERMQREVNNGLLFKVRVMNNQLKKPEVSA